MQSHPPYLAKALQAIRLGSGLGLVFIGGLQVVLWQVGEGRISPDTMQHWLHAVIGGLVVSGVIVGVGLVRLCCKR